jgi:thiamine-monophosphate kinase
MVRRMGARAGDDVYVTGTIGDSGGGLAIFRRETHTLDEAQRDALIARYRVPQPPMVFGAQDLRSFASAAADVSDGLIADLSHVAEASGVKLVVDADAIPRSDALRAFWGDEDAAIIRAATAGDDYQVVFTADPANRTAIAALGGATRIGQAEAGQGVELRRSGAVLPVARTGFRHF